MPLCGVDCTMANDASFLCRTTQRRGVPPTLRTHNVRTHILHRIRRYPEHISADRNVEANGKRVFEELTWIGWKGQWQNKAPKEDVLRLVTFLRWAKGVAAFATDAAVTREMLCERASPLGQLPRFRADRRHNRRFRAAFRKPVAVRAPYSACIFGGIAVPPVSGMDAPQALVGAGDGKSRAMPPARPRSSSIRRTPQARTPETNLLPPIASCCHTF